MEKYLLLLIFTVFYELGMAELELSNVLSMRPGFSQFQYALLLLPDQLYALQYFLDN